MNKQEMQKEIERLEAQRDQLLLQLGSVNGAIAVYRQFQQNVPDAAPSAVSVGEVKS
jgi:hypothetical protein